jgi:hypothetical protein
VNFLLKYSSRLHYILYIVLILNIFNNIFYLFTELLTLAEMIIISKNLQCVVICMQEYLIVLEK